MIKFLYGVSVALILAGGFGIVVKAETENEKNLDALEAACESSLGVLARMRQGYKCVVPVHQLIRNNHE
jgi:hypothetical protein